jgi:PAS domain S-box-containing protein
MTNATPGKMRKENDELRQRLAEAEETLRAITAGEVDALVVKTKDGEKVFTLQNADTIYRIMIDNINEGAINISANGTILYSNHYFAKMTQTRLGKVIGASIFSFVSPKSRKILTSLLGKKNGRGEISLLSSDGTQVPAYIAIKKLNLNGLDSICAVITGLTQQKQSEEIIREGKLKDEFIGMVSHEIKTPLTVIIGALSTVTAEGVTQPEARELLQDAVDHADILASIVDNLLELSRSQADRLVLQKEPTDIRGIAQIVAEKLRGKSPIHQLVIDIPTGLPMVEADPLRAERVLYNLIDNAIKYSPNGGEVKISARREKEHMLVSVSDHGLGISQIDQRRLFQKFQRLDVMIKRSIQGIGLGLNVCRILVEAHGGEIWVESRKGKGSTFFFTIPFYK